MKLQLVFKSILYLCVCVYIFFTCPRRPPGFTCTTTRNVHSARCVFVCVDSICGGSFATTVCRRPTENGFGTLHVYTKKPANSILRLVDTARLLWLLWSISCTIKLGQRGLFEKLWAMNVLLRWDVCRCNHETRSQNRVGTWIGTYRVAHEQSRNKYSLYGELSAKHPLGKLTLNKCIHFNVYLLVNYIWSRIRIRNSHSICVFIIHHTLCVCLSLYIVEVRWQGKTAATQFVCVVSAEEIDSHSLHSSLCARNDDTHMWLVCYVSARI